MVDRFSRSLGVAPIPDQEAITTAGAFFGTWISRLGILLRIITYQGRQFESWFFHEIANLFGQPKSELQHTIRRLMAWLSGARHARIAGCVITVSVDQLKPAYAMIDDIEDNPISDQQQEASVAKPTPERDIRKIVQVPVQQFEVANSTKSGRRYRKGLQ